MYLGRCFILAGPENGISSSGGEYARELMGNDLEWKPKRKTLLCLIPVDSFKASSPERVKKS